MKILDVESLLSGIDSNKKEIESFQERLSALQRAVRDFTALDDELGGEGGEAIRAFYNDCHQPFLVFLNQSLTDYRKVLIDIQRAIGEFEPDERGYVSQSYLEHEVESGLDEVKMTAIELAGKANDVIASVSDIVSLPKIDESDVIHQVERGKDRIKNVVDGLYSLDDYSVSQLEKTKQDLNTMMTYLSELESKFQSGELSIENYKVSAVSDMESFRAITECVFGDGGIFGIILNKLKNGEPIKAFERDSLYNYFQNEILNVQAKKELEEIANIINEKDINQLKERLNDKVVISKDSLIKEIAMIQAHTFMGHKKLNNEKDRENMQKLEVYLNLLRNYYTVLDKWDAPVAQIYELKYEKNPNGISGHYLETLIQTDDYRLNVKNKMSKEEFHDLTFGPEMMDVHQSVKKNIDKVEITYLSTADAALLDNYLKTEKLMKKDAYYISNFILEQTIVKIISLMGKKAGAGKILYDFLEGKAELEDKITIEKAKNAAALMGMELSISNHHTNEGSSSGIQVQIHPTKTTFEILERWTKEYNNNENIPYPPENLIESQDWYRISKYLYNHNTEFENNVYDYIRYGTD